MFITPKDVDRFWSKIDKSGEHWLYTGATDGVGYGQFWLNAAQEKAHRVAWEIMFGKIPDGMWVLHKPPCVTRTCVLHLYLGDIWDNDRDCKESGRIRNFHVLGETNPRAILNDDLVRKIRIRHSETGWGAIRLAKEFPVSKSAIGDVLSRKRWSHVR